MAQLNMTLVEIQEMLGEGRLIGEGKRSLAGVASLGRAGEGDLSFVRDASFSDKARDSKAGALLVPEELQGMACCQLVLEDPNRAFGAVLERIARDQRRSEPGVHPTAEVSDSASVHPTASIGPRAVVSDDAVVGERTVIGSNVFVGKRSRVGADCTLKANVVLVEDVTLGDRVTLHPGSVIGTDGYGYIPGPQGHFKIPHVGSVRIGDDVEIGALSTVDRATVDETVIGSGSKLGDMCHVAHNCQVGEHVLMLPRASIAGSVTLGNHVVIAGRSGCADNLTIGEGAMIGGASCAFEDVPPGVAVWGNPAREKDLEFRIQALLRRLPEMRAKLRALSREMNGDEGE